MAELQTQSIATVTLTEVEKKEIALQVAQSISEGNVAVNLSNADKADIASQIATDWAQNGITVNISDQDKADIVQEVLAELYAKSQQTRTLEKVSSLDGITTIPGVRDDNDIVAVPLGLLTVAIPKQIQSEEDIAILEAKGELVATQIYFTEEEDD